MRANIADEFSKKREQIPQPKKTFDDWQQEEKKEKNPLLTFEEYLTEKFWRIINKIHRYEYEEK
jgi:hypothetical protein